MAEECMRQLADTVQQQQDQIKSLVQALQRMPGVGHPAQLVRTIPIVRIFSF